MVYITWRVVVPHVFIVLMEKATEEYLERDTFPVRRYEVCSKIVSMCLSARAMSIFEALHVCCSRVLEEYLFMWILLPWMYISC